MTDTTTLDDVVVIGKRKKPNAAGNPLPEQMQEVEQETGDPGGGGGFALTPEDEAENQRQKDCAAQKFNQKLQADQPFQKSKKEFFASIFDRNGDTVVHPPVIGTGAAHGFGPGTGITNTDISGANSTYGVTGDLLGFVHNHPRDVYCNSEDNYTEGQQRLTNQYPSAEDWAAAEGMVPEGDPNNFVLYIVGCDSQLRAFPYRDREEFKAERAKTNPKAHPPVQPEGCEG